MRKYEEGLKKKNDILTDFQFDQCGCFVAHRHALLNAENSHFCATLLFSSTTGPSINQILESINYGRKWSSILFRQLIFIIGTKPMTPKTANGPKAHAFTRLQKKSARIRVSKPYKRKGKDLAIWGPKFRLPRRKPKKIPGYRHKSISFCF